MTQTVGYGALIQAFTVLLIPMAADLGASRPAVAGAATISTLVGAIAAVPVGHLLDRFGGRMLMSVGSAVAVVAVVVWAQATSIAHLYVAFGMVGLALAMSTYEAAFAVLVVATEADSRDRAILAVTSITGLATGLYYPLAGWLESTLGWRAAVLVMGGLIAAVALPAHLWAVPARAVHVRRVARRTGVPVGTALRDPRLYLIGVAFLAQAGAVAGFLLMLVTYLRDIGHSVAVATTMPAIVGVLMVVSRLALSPLARRYGMTRVTTVSFVVQGLGMLALPLVGASLGLAVACVATVGLGQGIGVIARPSIVADAFGAARFGSIIAVLTVPIALSRSGTPLLAAWLADWRFLVMTGVASLAAAAALAPLTRARARLVEAPHIPRQRGASMSDHTAEPPRTSGAIR
ncbi:MFS transporter [Luedemannella helvata]|uniref:MFS transporter n=1 Tax=Luedemannella helvata TaxID=349315 RepID=A0ABP4VWD8_9ACTN